MTLNSLNKYYDSKNQKDYCSSKNYYTSNVVDANSYSIQTYSSHQLYNYVMNLNRSSPPNSLLKRSPSNLSEISQFSISNQIRSQGLYTDYKLGDYVYVDSISGIKYGIIRYAGYTDFAPGYWFGIELNEPNGKNNGTIRGKSYFNCPDFYGIFTQASKISKSSPIKQSKKLSSLGSNFGSKESINSTSYLRKNHLNISQESLRSCVSGVSEITGVFKAPNREQKRILIQKMKNEKEEFEKKFEINDLSKDLSVLKMKEQCEKLENEKNELINLKKQVNEKFKLNDEEIIDLKRTINKEKKLNKELLNQLDEEKKKSEVFEFRLEEEIVNRMQLDEELQKKNELIKELNKKTLKLENLKEDENEIEMFQLQEDIIRKEEKLMQLESSLKTKQLENSDLLERTREFEQTLKLFEQRQENYINKIDELNLTIKKYEQKTGQLEEILYNKKEELNANQHKSISNFEEINKQVQELSVKLNKKNDENLLLKKEIEKINNETQDNLKEKQNLLNKLEEIRNELDNKNKLIEDKNHEYQDKLKQNVNSKHTEQELKKKMDELNQLVYKAKNKVDEYEQVIQILKKEINSKNERISNIEKDLELNNQKIECLTDENIELKKNFEKKSIEYDNLNSKLDYYYGNFERSKTQKQKLEIELDNLQTLIDEREESLHNFVKKKMQFQNEMQGLIREITTEKKRNEELVQNQIILKTKHEKELCNICCKLNESQKLFEKINVEYEIKCELLEKLEYEYCLLKEEMEKFKTINIKLEKELNSITLVNKKDQNEINLLNQKLNKKLDKINQELISTLNENKCLNNDLVEKDIEINNLKVNHQEELHKIEQQNFLECFEFEKKIKNLEEKLNYQNKQLIEEKNLNNDDKDLCESQIKFLNEVIVDMQKKNDELNNKIKILDEIRLKEMNIYKIQVDDLVNLDENQFNFKKITSNLNAKEKQLAFNSPRRTIRLFCSFCEKFDIHDTEDCKSNEAKLDEQNHSKYGQTRKQNRPYCVYCETFEHWTYNCLKVAS